MHKLLHWVKAMLMSALLLGGIGCDAETPYSNASPGLNEAQLSGTWEARYSPGALDTLVLREDGTFRQTYRDTRPKEYKYTFETPWNAWIAERFPDGRIRLHLRGARYYPAGIASAEREGMHPPVPPDRPDLWPKSGPLPMDFWDPIGREPVQMVGELVLNVQRTRAGKLVLLHMVQSRDEGWIGLFSGRAVGFRRIEVPPTPQASQTQEERH